MSHYVECQTEFRDPNALVDALQECGFSREQIEVHEEAVELRNYRGEVSPNCGQIVIRKEYLGPISNDAGWEKQPDGTYKAWISDVDAGVGDYSKYRETAKLRPEILKKLRQEYAYHVIRRQQEIRGRQVERTRLPSGEIEVLIQGYR